MGWAKARSAWVGHVKQHIAAKAKWDLVDNWAAGGELLTDILCKRLLITLNTYLG